MSTERPRRVLIVNDSQEILDLLREILVEEGHEVVGYSSTFDDLADVKRIAPDVIILDFIIGDENHGWQFLQKLKLDRATATIPVVVCSAAMHLLRELEGHLRDKSVGVVPKPFDIDDLLRAVDAAWQRAQLERSNEPGAEGESAE